MLQLIKISYSLSPPFTSTHLLQDVKRASVKQVSELQSTLDELTSWKATATERIAALESTIKGANEDLASQQKDLAEMKRSSAKRITELEGSLSIGEDELADKRKKLGNIAST